MTEEMPGRAYRYETLIVYGRDLVRCYASEGALEAIGAARIDSRGEEAARVRARAHAHALLGGMAIQAALGGA